MRYSVFKGIVLAGAIAVATVSAPMTANAKVVVSEATKYYSIKGKNGLEVSKAMLSGGARNINMRHAIAATATRFDVGKADVVVKNGRCVVNDVVVKLDITFYYPTWPGKKGASAQTQKAWNAFHAELEKHERTHASIAKDGAKQLEKELKRISGTVASGCRDFGRFSAPRLNAVAANLKNRQLAFDAKENQKNSKITKLQIALLKSK